LSVQLSNVTETFPVGAIEHPNLGGQGGALEAAGLRQRLCAACGAEAVLDDAATLELAAHDIFHRAPMRPDAVLRPADRAALVAGVRVLAEAGVAIAPRGGGMSYTGGYLPQERFVCVDLTRLNRVLEVNAEDLFITVEAGCTWAQVRQALAGTGFTTPYGGPLSGLRATVGGALSQNSMFFGAGQHGTAAESVLGLSVLLADGEVI
jgi:D-lactate dehydrogenase (cytochrome)